MISEVLQKQIDALLDMPEGVIAEVEGMRQTVEDPKSLVLDPDNAMTHNAQNLAAIGNSLNQFGFRKNAIAVREGTRVVYAGNGIVTYCLRNEIPVCPVVWIPESMSEEEAKAFALADNQSAKLSEWDQEVMLQNLEEVAKQFSPDSLGFDDEEIAQKLSELREVDEAVGTMGAKPAKPKADKKSGLIKILFAPKELSTVEKALRAADKASRGEALTEICEEYLKRHPLPVE